METDATTIRLTRADRKNIARIVSSGSAKNASEAIRVALYEAAERRRVSAQGQEKTA